VEKLLYAFLAMLPVVQWELYIRLWGLWKQTPMGGGHGFVSLQRSRIVDSGCVELEPADIRGKQGFPMEEQQI